MLGVEPPTSRLRGQSSTTRSTWQVRLNGVQVCAQASTKHVQSFVIWQLDVNSANLEKVDSSLH